MFGSLSYKAYSGWSPGILRCHMDELIGQADDNTRAGQSLYISPNLVNIQSVKLFNSDPVILRFIKAHLELMESPFR